MSKKDNDWKDRLGTVYSTSDNYEYEYSENEEEETLEIEKQRLKIFLDKKQRKGKQVTLIKGFIGTTDDLNILAKELKNKCGVGGSAKDGEIIIQGDLREKVKQVLSKMGYKV